MINLEDALKKLKYRVSTKTTHKDYERTVKLADFYFKMITGEKASSLLSQFIKRESKEEFEQRAELTITTSPSILNKAQSPFNKLASVQGVKSNIITKNSNKEEINKAISHYFGDEDLDFYLKNKIIDLIFCDPNAFIVTEWDEFDANTEKAKPRPFEVYSANAIDYEYKNNILQYLVSKNENIYEDNGKIKTGYKYTMYTSTHNIVFEQIGSKENIEEGYERFVTEDKRHFKYSIIETGLKSINAIRVGYIFDKVTNNRTCVSPIHASEPYLNKLLKTISEFDLTTCLHAFPQKIQYVEACAGVSREIGCRNGVTINGDNCKSCKGLGYVIHTSSQDAIIKRLPADKEEMIDLDKLVVYKQPPIDILGFQRDLVDTFENKILGAIFASELFINGGQVKTATEKIIELDSVYDVLRPFADNYSKIWKSITYTICDVIDEDKEIVVVHKFPKDFKFQTKSSLINDLKLANESKAPQLFIDEISKDLIRLSFVDDPIALRKYEIQNEHTPFKGKTNDEVKIILATNIASQKDKLMWVYRDLIFKEIEEENENFYLLNFDKRKTIIDAKINSMINLEDAPINFRQSLEDET